MSAETGLEVDELCSRTADQKRVLAGKTANRGHEVATLMRQERGRRRRVYLPGTATEVTRRRNCRSTRQRGDAPSEARKVGARRRGGLNGDGDGRARVPRVVAMDGVEHLAR